MASEESLRRSGPGRTGRGSIRSSSAVSTVPNGRARTAPTAGGGRRRGGQSGTTTASCGGTRTCTAPVAAAPPSVWTGWRRTLDEGDVGRTDRAARHWRLRGEGDDRQGGGYCGFRRVAGRRRWLSVSERWHRERGQQQELGECKDHDLQPLTAAGCWRF